MEEDRVVSSVFMRPQTPSDVFEWEAIDYLRERLFCDFRGEQVRHGSRKDALVVCVENVAHAACVNVIGGGDSRPPRGVIHIVFSLKKLVVVVLRMRQQVEGSCVERKGLMLAWRVPTSQALSTEAGWRHCGQ